MRMVRSSKTGPLYHIPVQRTEGPLVAINDGATNTPHLTRDFMYPTTEGRFCESRPCTGVDYVEYITSREEYTTSYRVDVTVECVL